MLWALFMVSFAQANVFVTIKNKTSMEFDFGKDYKPYVANEIALNPFGPNYIFNKNKVMLGFKYKANSTIEFDPHWFIQNQRRNNWSFEHGPELRMDIKF